MARPLQFLELASGASGVLRSLASIPSGADNAVIKFDSGTARWSETSGSWLTASTGLLMSQADPPLRIESLTKFQFYPMGGAAAVSVLYYGYEGRMYTG